MPVKRSSRRFSSARLEATARRLLGASTLCAIATVTSTGRAHVNTAYFAWTRSFEILWISSPDARHSRNLRANSTAAIAVYDSHQSWGGRDRGIQLFGAAGEARGAAAAEAMRLYGRRFRAYDTDLRAYRAYRFRPRRMKLFHEAVLGGGVFVTAKVAVGGRLAWVRTEIYTGDS